LKRYKALTYDVFSSPAKLGSYKIADARDADGVAATVEMAWAVHGG
jgi:hypothetical protein